MRLASRCLLFASLCWFGTAVAGPTIALQADVPVAFSLPAHSFNNSYYFDVGPSANGLTITIENGTGDPDVLLRYGSPFPDTLDGVNPPSADYLIELAQYRSISQFATERIAIDRSNVFPVREGRWYIALVNTAEDTPAAGQVRAVTNDLNTSLVPIEVLFNDPGDSGDEACNTAPWNDTAPRAPVGGNAGTTLGQQRRNALTEAARLLSLQLRSPVPVRIIACWKNLGTGNSVTLAQAGARDIILGGKYLPRGQTAYTITPAAKLAGANYCGLIPTDGCEHGEVRATFNDQIDTPNALGAASFYYGFTAIGGNNVDFISVAMHEITHGLGFQSTVNVDPVSGPVGAKLRIPLGGGAYRSFDDIYSANVVYAPGNGTFKRFLDISDAERATAMTTEGGLRWDDPAAVNASGNGLFAGAPPPDNFVRLYSPTTLTPGSTLSHLSTAYGSGELMTPIIVGTPRSQGLSNPMLKAMGWSPDPRTPKSDAPQFSGVYYDPAHPGHGIGFTRIVGDVYFLAFYTYSDTGAPEWYISIGSIVDGIFTPGPNANGDSLVRYKYNANATPKQQADPSMHGAIRLDFNDAKYAQVCSQSPHNTSGPLALMTFELSSDPADLANPLHPKELQWCMQPIIPPGAAAPPDYSGTWNAGSGDSGWGYSLASYGAAPTSGLFGVLYYPDANGDGRWAYLQGGGPNGTDYNLVERHGYCRACAVPDSIKAGQYDDRVAGTIKLTLNGTVQGQPNGQSIFDLTYQLPPNGQFKRPDSQMVLLSVPAQ